MRKKSSYKPRPVRVDNLNWILAGMKKVGTLPTAGVDLKLKNHGALDSILMGNGTRDHVDVLISALNICEALVRIRDDLGVDWANEIRAAQDGEDILRWLVSDVERSGDMEEEEMGQLQGGGGPCPADPPCPGCTKPTVGGCRTCQRSHS